MSKGLTPEQEQRIIDKLVELHSIKWKSNHPEFTWDDKHIRILCENQYQAWKQSGALDEVISICQEEMESKVAMIAKEENWSRMEMIDTVADIYEGLEQLKTNNNE